MKTGSKESSVDLGVVNEDDEIVTNAPAMPEGVVNEDSDDIPTLPRGAVENADRSVTVTLDTPITFQSKSQRSGELTTRHYDELKFHRLNGSHMTEIATASDGARFKVAFACSTRMSKGLMNGIYDRMDAADIERCGKVIEYFLGSGRKTGR
jgi:hypothetical protein